MYWHWIWWQIIVCPPEDRVLDKSCPEYTGWFTCTYCASQKKCRWAFDLYNTNFDCLADK